MILFHPRKGSLLAADQNSPIHPTLGMFRIGADVPVVRAVAVKAEDGDVDR